MSEVVLMCGVAGSGKTTYARRLESAGFVRLSIDEAIWARFGRFGLDYDESRYPEYQRVSEQSLRVELAELIRQGRDVVVDVSFWSRARRDEYKEVIAAGGGRWRLVYLRVPVSELRRRLAERATRFDANAAFPITEDILTSYLDGFEEPRGEGEEIVDA